MHEPVHSRRSQSRCKIHSSWLIIRTEASDADFNVRANRRACFTLAPVVACHSEIRHLCSQTFNAARLLQLVVPTSTRFTAPLLAQPDLSREKSLASRSSSRLTAHNVRNKFYVIRYPTINES